MDRPCGAGLEHTRPRLLTFSESAAEASAATHGTIRHVRVPHGAFMAGVAAGGVAENGVWLLDYCRALALVELGRPSAAYFLAGAVVYLTGTFLVTGLANVPLNDRLAAVDAADSAAEPF